MGHLELQQLTKMFGSKKDSIIAVDELDITVQDGEFLVLVGPSGCGKSTTLRCIAGLETVTSGTITLDGRDITRLKPKERGMAMVFQNYALYPHMSVRKNIGYGLSRTSDLADDEIARRVEETASILEIEDLLGQKPAELSGGQQQRVALGRAIIREPSVFLMDEPLSNLDAKLRTTMRTEIQQLQQDMGTTTIYVTHDQTEAMTMGDRIAILDGGKLQQIGPPLKCYHEPVNRFVAGFIGSPSMNFFAVERDDNNLVHEQFTYRSSSIADTEDTPRRLTLGIRPEHIQITDGSERNAIRSEIKVVEPMGERTYLYIGIGDTTYTISIEGSLNVKAGEEVHIVFPEDRIHLFDAETGVALKNSDSDELTEQPPRT